MHRKSFAHRSTSQAGSARHEGCSVTGRHPEVLPLFLQLLTIPVRMQARPMQTATEHTAGCTAELPGTAQEVPGICCPAVLNRCLRKLRKRILKVIDFPKASSCSGSSKYKNMCAKPISLNLSALQPTGYNERIVGVSLLPFQPMQKLILQMEPIVHGMPCETRNTIEHTRMLPSACAVRRNETGMSLGLYIPKCGYDSLSIGAQPRPCQRSTVNRIPAKLRRQRHQCLLSQLMAILTSEAPTIGPNLVPMSTFASGPCIHAETNTEQTTCHALQNE